jgi:type I restriction enzyme S subunit
MNWKRSSLDEIAEYVGRGKSPVYDEESPYPVLNQACIQHGKLDLSKLKFVAKAHFESLDATRKTQRGDILVNSTGTGTLGRIGYWDVDKSIPFDGHVMLVRLKPEYESRYFYYWLHMPEAQAQIQNNCISGSTNQIELSREAFRRIKLRFPANKQEQAKIAEVLATVDRAIEQTETLIAKHQRIKAGLMHDLLTRGIDENGNLRDPATHRFKPSPLGRIPAEWECLPSEAVCEDICVGIVLKPSQYYQDTGVPTLRSANIREDGINTDDLVFISEQANKLLAKSMVREGYVLTVRTGYPGTSAVVPKELDGANCIDLVISKPGPRIISHYLATWINSPLGKDQILKRQGGLAQQHFNIGEMKKLLILVPGFDEQQRILKVITVQNKALQIELSHLLKFQSLKTGLMQDLLTGKVSVERLLTTAVGEPV